MKEHFVANGMVIVRLMGGLGNQMFQYAAGLRLASVHKTVCKVDLSFLQDRSDDSYTHRDFDLGIFRPPIEIASPAEIRRFRRLLDPTSRSLGERILDKLGRRRVHVDYGFVFQPTVLELPNETYLEGYFQNEKYFVDHEAEIRRTFELSSAKRDAGREVLELSERIRGEDAICLHVRRGDYVSNPVTAKYHGALSEHYYRNALSALRTRGVLGPVYVFSDDPAWCDRAFADFDRIMVVGSEHAGPGGSHHLWLMTLCRNFIISNSSFSWWAAWLASTPGKVVVRPLRWFRGQELSGAEICPEGWMPLGEEVLTAGSIATHVK